MPVFAEFDCPVTAFLVTGFLDGALWLWWDQLHYALFATPRRALTLAVNGSILHYEFEDTAGRERTAKRLAEELKCVANDEKKKLIATVASELDVEVPKHCPPRYRPMTWEQVRSCASLGATFGPHTLSHPILSRVSDDEAAHEIAESWSRVQSETTASLPVLAYPNGDTASFGERERRLARSAGLVAAVTTEQEHVAGRRFAAGGPDPYQLPRFSYPDTVEEFAHIAGGLVHAIRTCRLAKPNGRPDPTGHRNLSP
jgi:peptidoglycan/xylan/chitin deacetylase (PgdA/CDA1 family)